MCPFHRKETSFTHPCSSHEASTAIVTPLIAASAPQVTQTYIISLNVQPSPVIIHFSSEEICINIARTGSERMRRKKVEKFASKINQT